MPFVSPALADALDALAALLRSDALSTVPSRDDDLALLQETRDRLERRFTLAVLGEFSSGKSYLLNALLGKSHYDDRGRIAGLLATDINPSTAAITEIEYGATEEAYAKYSSGRTERVPMEGLSRFVAVAGSDESGALHDATDDEGASPSFVVVRVDSPFLRAGFVVADTPGLASLNPAHRRATLAYLPRADAVLYLIDTQQPFTDGDAAFLGLIGEHVRTIFVVQTKIDLWRSQESDGRETWRAARDRIESRAAVCAPGADVFSVSAYEYALARLSNDDALAATSGVPALLAALERTLEDRAQAARVSRAVATLHKIGTAAAERVRYAASLASYDVQALQRAACDAETTLAERERALVRERDRIAGAGAARLKWVVSEGNVIRERAVRMLATTLDVADIERLRDRGKLALLIDRALTGLWREFAVGVASDTARELEVFAREHSMLRIADLAAKRLGGDAGAGSWSRDLASGITTAIALGAAGGPAISFVAALARKFAEHPAGTYMKRELTADATQTLLPQFAADVDGFVRDIAGRLAGVYADAADVVEAERARARADLLGPIDRALRDSSGAAATKREQGTVSTVSAAQREATERLELFERRIAALGAIGEVLELPSGPAFMGAASPAPSRAEAASSTAFDTEAYGRALRPERYRVVLLGALRRGKTSLINAVAGTRLLRDDAAREVAYPIHVRYGPKEHAHALGADGQWHEIATDDAISCASKSPVLVEIPWTMPQELVLVHAPAFDSGDAQAEAIAVAAARNASEVLGLFSRQLSERELALYERVARLHKPLLLAHTIADNESPAERRIVVELAGRYLRERGINVDRIFTVSALDYLDALRARRPPAAWNEFAALRETLSAHADAHMQRARERERLRRELARRSSDTPPRAKAFPTLRRLFGRH